MTIDELSALGANTTEGLARCAGMEAFYLQLIPKALDAGKFTELDNLLKEKKYDEAFEVAHSLKGVLANLSLTPVFEPVSEITEGLRTKKDLNYEELLNKMWDARNRFAELL